MSRGVMPFPTGWMDEEVDSGKDRVELTEIEWIEEKAFRDLAVVFSSFQRVIGGKGCGGRKKAS
jgi:hypothetical protein